jgi:hypothetical protein
MRGAWCAAGRQTYLYQLFRLRGAGHDLNTVTCFYSWTKHSAMCVCGMYVACAVGDAHAPTF